MFKKIIKIAAITLLVLIAIAFAAPYLYKSQIVALDYSPYLIAVETIINILTKIVKTSQDAELFVAGTVLGVMRTHLLVAE